MNFELLSLLYDYGGLVIGFVILVFASFFLLPVKVRWHVLFAGSTLVVFRAYQIYDSRKKLKQADAERNKLRAEHDELESWMKKLEAENERLRAEKKEIEAERNRLRLESERVNAEAEVNITKKQALDKQANEILERHEQNRNARQTQLSAIEKALQLQRQLAAQ